MFCGKCGTQNADDALFCAGCGASLSGGDTENSIAPVPADDNGRNRKVGIIAVAAAAVVLVLIAALLFGGRGYKATVEKFMDAILDADAETIVELLPDKVIDYALEESGYDKGDLDELIDELDQELEDEFEYMELYFGDSLKMTYEILDAEDMKGDDLEEVQDFYDDMKVKVTAVKQVEVEITIKLGEMETSETMIVSVMKVGGSWYLNPESMGSIF